MADDRKPKVDCDRYHAGLRVADLNAAVDFYTRRLGFELGFTWGQPPTMAGVDLGEIQVFLVEGEPQPEGCTLYFVIGDADELYAFHRSQNVQILAELEDREYGIRDYAIQDLYGHRLVFGHYIYSGGPPLEVERVDVNVRLEKRLAALLHDLAAYKRMTLTSCLEEILLHTSEPHGDGVASPHTPAQLAHIQALKAKHGIDYDVHASYRFVETRRSDPQYKED